MKKILLLGWVTIIAGTISTAQPITDFYYFQKGNVYEKTIFNGRNEIIARQEYQIINLTEENGVSTALVQIITIKNGKETERTTGLFVTDHTTLQISMGKTKNGTDVYIEYPADMKPHQKLESGISFETEAKIVGQIIKVYCTIGGRQVLSVNESVITSLGTWDCVKTSYDMELRGKIFGIGIPVNVSVFEWSAPGFGIVRTDIYRSGKLYERRLLTNVRH